MLKMVVTRVSFSCLSIKPDPICDVMEATLVFKSFDNHSLLGDCEKHLQVWALKRAHKVCFVGYHGCFVCDLVFFDALFRFP